MGYVKVVKNKNYYKRFRVKYRRRRQAKTDYRIRRRLITQDKRKYNAPKWRLVVRISNKDVIAQVTAAKMVGDQVMCAAYAHELQRYGLKVGLTNYAGCYCTGLLLARRLLKKVGLDEKYIGKRRLDGKRFLAHESCVFWKPEESKSIRRPFKCVLDTGLARCTTGARVFAVMKGAADGGLNIPHSMKRLPGFKKGEGDAKDEYHPDVLRTKIFGGHVSKYMEHLKENNPDKYSKHFSQYIKEGIEPNQLEELYSKVHKAIRKDPSAPPKVKRDWKAMDVRKKMSKMPREEKVRRRNEKVAAMQAQAAAAAAAAAPAEPEPKDVTMNDEEEED